MTDLLNSESLSKDELSSFIENHENSQSFALSLEERTRVWQILLSTIEGPSVTPTVRELCLKCCRILSRDPTGINQVIQNSHVDLLIQIASISTPGNSLTDVDRLQEAVHLQAKKVLFNLVKQSFTVRARCCHNGFIGDIFKAISQHKEKGELQRFDLRLLFLLTVLTPEQRQTAKQDHRGLAILNEILQRCSVAPYNMESATYLADLLMVLFNLTLVTENHDTQDLINICQSLKPLIKQKFESEEADQIVISNIINFLTTMENKVEPTRALFSEKDLDSVQRILDLLLLKLSQHADDHQIRLAEVISPCLQVLWSLSKMHPHIRRYLKRTILPPLTTEDIKKKPEQGRNARGRLVSLLTNPDQKIATMTAELLFVLCKHKVGKLVKYSGYGNAAGLLARRGLMTGGSADQSEADFSSSSDSDTEEYQQEAHKVNPITGCVEEKRTNPLEGMSDEQKEYEAVKLVNMLDKLIKDGAIQPATIGDDGKPVALEHVLQLQDNKKHPVNKEDPTDSSDELD